MITVTYEQLLACHDVAYIRAGVEATLREAWAEVDSSDPTFLPDMTAEQLETELRESFGHVDRTTLSQEERDELEGLETMLRTMRGKRLSELPGPTAEEDEATIQEEVDLAVAQLTSSWLGLLSITSRRPDRTLKDDLTPEHHPVQGWYANAGSSCGLSEVQVGAAQWTFATELLRLIGAADEVDLAGSDVVVERRDGRWCVREDLRDDLAVG